MPQKLKVLFLCTGNSCRSQMAEGWARHLKGEVIEAYSAGVEKHALNPRAIKVMEEAGVDMSGHYSKTLDELPIKDFDYVITLCDQAKESCPVFLGKTKRLHHSFPDPPKLAASACTEIEAIGHYRLVRDEIRKFIETMPDSLEG